MPSIDNKPYLERMNDEPLSSGSSRQEDRFAQQAADQRADFSHSMERKYGTNDRRRQVDARMSTTPAERSDRAAMVQKTMRKAEDTLSDELALVSDLRDAAKETSKDRIPQTLRNIASSREQAAVSEFISTLTVEREMLEARKMAIERIREENELGFKSLSEMVNAHRQELVSGQSLMTEAERREAQMLLELSRIAGENLRAQAHMSGMPEVAGPKTPNLRSMSADEKSLYSQQMIKDQIEELGKRRGKTGVMKPAPTARLSAIEKEKAESLLPFSQETERTLTNERMRSRDLLEKVRKGIRDREDQPTTVDEEFPLTQDDIEIIEQNPSIAKPPLRKRKNSDDQLAA
jgi:hypothetical protein